MTKRAYEKSRKLELAVEIIKTSSSFECGHVTVDVEPQFEHVRVHCTNERNTWGATDIIPLLGRYSTYFTIEDGKIVLIVF